MNWAESVKFLNEIGVLPLVILLLAFPLGSVLSLVLMKRMLFTKFSFKEAFDGWLSDQRKRTEIEVKLEMRLGEFTSELKGMVAANWDLRRFFDAQHEDSQGQHTIIIQHLENLLLLAKKRKSDWIRPRETEMFLQARDTKEKQD